MTKEELQRYYNECFGNPASRYSRMVKDVIDDGMITSDTCMLDYGCGTGIVSHYLYQKFNCKIDAVDISRDEIAGAKIAWKQDNINWISIEDFEFPKEKYDLIVSSQVIEHIHNVGNYLNVINRMLKPNGVLLIGTPNVMTLGLLWRQFRIKSNALNAWSEEMLNAYDKGMDHINAWDTYHFVALLASCGFKMEKFLPTEGVTIPRFNFFKLLPRFRKTGGVYADSMNKRLFKNLCYTQHFIFRKVKSVEIQNTD